MNEPISHKQVASASLGCLLALATVSWFASCDYNDDEDIDHDPPAGLGSIIVKNDTANDISVFINGTATNEVDAFEVNYYDMTAGVYRVVLDEQDGDRNYREDIDVLQDQRTILDVNTDSDDYDEYDVFVYFD